MSKSTAKRTPSILVTDVRTAPSTGRSAPFVSRAGPSSIPNSGNNARGRTQFESISIDNILSDVGDIPSAHKRSVPKFMRVGGRRGASTSARVAGGPNASGSGLTGTPQYNHPVGGVGGGINDSGRHRSVSTGSNVGVGSSSGPGINANTTRNGVGNGNTYISSGGKKSGPPPRLSQNIPSRTTKLSQKLVLIPEDQERGFHFEDTETDEIEPPPTPYRENINADEFESDRPRRSYAERLPKDRRTEKFPRVTAYCIADGMRLQTTMEFLRENHKIRPRIYDEALFAPYFLPLLPGDGEGSRVKSSPGGIMMLEQLIDLSEQGDHHFEYFSGGEGGGDNPDSTEDHDDNTNGSNGINIDHSNNDGLIGGSGIIGSSDSPGISGGINISDISSPNNRFHQIHQEEDLWQENSPNFDPSEPQDFSPRDHVSYMPTSATRVIDRTIEEEEEEGEESRNKTAELDQSVDSNHNISSVNQPNLIDIEIENDSLLPVVNPIQSSLSEELNIEALPPPQQPEAFTGTNTGEGVGGIIPLRKRHSTADDLKHAEIFIFSYGVVVFWNFTENQEKAILADLMFGKNGTKSLAVRPINDHDIETEEMHFTYSPHTRKPRIYNDMITLRSGDHMIKLAMSHAIAQSTKLSRFEARMDINMHDVKHVPRMLALTGKLGMKREEVLKISGKLFKLRVDVNLSSNVLDTPEFFWESEPSLNPLYTAIREYLEIEQRILVLNERCKVFLELAEIIADSIAEANMSRITWIIIILIVLSLGVSSVSIKGDYQLFDLLSNIIIA